MQAFKINGLLAGARVARSIAGRPFTHKVGAHFHIVDRLRITVQVYQWSIHIGQRYGLAIGVRGNTCRDVEHVFQVIRVVSGIGAGQGDVFTNQFRGQLILHLDLSPAAVATGDVGNFYF